MANICAFILNVILLLVLINVATAGRCTRLENAKRNLKVSGDGGYRILIDGDPKGYQPGKIYNGNLKIFLYSNELFFLFVYIK